LAVDLDIVKKSGSWFSYAENRLGQGRDSVKGLIKDNPELMADIEEKIKATVAGNADALMDKNASEADLEA
jgi:recombination protein RecA